MALDLSSSKWKLKINDYSRAIGSYPVSYKFPPRFASRLIKVSATSRSTKKKQVRSTWRSGGYLSQIQRDNESFNTKIPINQPVVIVLPLLQTSYQLAFKPVPWLPNLRLRVWEYKERFPQGLGVSGVEPVQVEIDQIQQQLQQLPEQIVQTIEILLDAGEI